MAWEQWHVQMLADALRVGAEQRARVIEVLALPATPGGEPLMMAIKADAVIALLPGHAEAPPVGSNGKQVVNLEDAKPREVRVTTIIMLGCPPLATVEPYETVVKKLRGEA